MQTFQSGLSCYSWYKLVTWIIYSFPDLLHLHKFELRGVFGFPMVKLFQNSQLIIIQFWNQSQNYGDSPHNYVISHLIIIHIYKQLVLMGSLITCYFWFFIIYLDMPSQSSCQIAVPNIRLLNVKIIILYQSQGGLGVHRSKCHKIIIT